MIVSLVVVDGYQVKEDMEKALSLNNHLVEGRHLRVDRAARDPNSHQLSVFLGNLPFDVDEETVRGHCSRHDGGRGGRNTGRLKAWLTW